MQLFYWNAKLKEESKKKMYSRNVFLIVEI